MQTRNETHYEVLTNPEQGHIASFCQIQTKERQIQAKDWAHHDVLVSPA